MAVLECGEPVELVHRKPRVQVCVQVGEECDMPTDETWKKRWLAVVSIIVAIIGWLLFT